MNTNHLAKLYDTLTARERVPLIIAAGARGDQAEQKRLSASAPKETFQVPDYYALAKALDKAADYHLLTLLDLAANFWQWWGLWMTYGLRDPDTAGSKKGQRRKAKADQAEELRAEGIVRYYASRFVAHVDGWKQFCSERHIDPEVQLHFLPGWDTITRTEGPARELAFTPEEAARFARQTVAVDDSLKRRPVADDPGQAGAGVVSPGSSAACAMPAPCAAFDVVRPRLSRACGLPLE